MIEKLKGIDCDDGFDVVVVSADAAVGACVCNEVGGEVDGCVEGDVDGAFVMETIFGTSISLELLPKSRFATNDNILDLSDVGGGGLVDVSGCGDVFVDGI